MIKNNSKENNKDHILNDIEKSLMRERVFSYVNSHPAVSKNDFYNGFRIYFSKRAVAAYSGVFILIFFASGAFAEKAFPGDTLYSFKLNINEQLLSVLSLDDKTKAKTHLFLAERRIAEMEILTLNKSINEVALAKLSDDFRGEALKVNKYVDELQLAGEVNNAADVNVSFEARLDAHKKILMQIDKVGTTTNPFIASMIDEIDNQNVLVEENQAEIGLSVSESKDEVGLKITAENNHIKAEGQIEELTKKIEDNTNVKEPLDFTVESKKLLRAKDLLSEGQKEFVDTNYKQAILKQSKASKEAEEVSTLIKVKSDLKLDIENKSDNLESKEGEVNTSEIPQSL